jgi:hypothetical protein
MLVVEFSRPYNVVRIVGYTVHLLPTVIELPKCDRLARSNSKMKTMDGGCILNPHSDPSSSVLCLMSICRSSIVYRPILRPTVNPEFFYFLLSILQQENTDQVQTAKNIVPLMYSRLIEYAPVFVDSTTTYKVMIGT